MEITDKTINTHFEAAKILDLFEELLDKYDITIPSPEDNERGVDNEAKLYGTTYSELLDEVETSLVELFETHAPDVKLIVGTF